MSQISLDSSIEKKNIACAIKQIFMKSIMEKEFKKRIDYKFIYDILV